jgi:hypothetical protein
MGNRIPLLLKEGLGVVIAAQIPRLSWVHPYMRQGFWERVQSDFPLLALHATV